MNGWLWLWLVMSRVLPNPSGLRSASLFARVFSVSKLVNSFVIPFLWRIWSSPRVGMSHSLLRFYGSMSFNQAAIFSIDFEVFLKRVSFLFVCSERLFSRVDSFKMLLILSLILKSLSIVFIDLILEFLLNTYPWLASCQSFLKRICQEVWRVE